MQVFVAQMKILFQECQTLNFSKMKLFRKMYKEWQRQKMVKSLHLGRRKYLIFLTFAVLSLLVIVVNRFLATGLTVDNDGFEADVVQTSSSNEEKIAEKLTATKRATIVTTEKTTTVTTTIVTTTIVTTTTVKRLRPIQTESRQSFIAESTAQCV